MAACSWMFFTVKILSKTAYVLDTNKGAKLTSKDMYDDDHFITPSGTSIGVP
jgi:hypothetical protein